jgi:hypothetical protein
MTTLHVPNRRDFNADDNARLALQTLLCSELRQASQARETRAQFTAAAIAGVTLGVLASALYFAAPFFGVTL